MNRPLSLMLILTLLCSACGQMGPLQLPPEEHQETDKKEEASQ